MQRGLYRSRRHCARPLWHRGARRAEVMAAVFSQERMRPAQSSAFQPDSTLLLHLPDDEILGAYGSPPDLGRSRFIQIHDVARLGVARATHPDGFLIIQKSP